MGKSNKRQNGNGGAAQQGGKKQRGANAAQTQKTPEQLRQEAERLVKEAKAAEKAAKEAAKEAAKKAKKAEKEAAKARQKAIDEARANGTRKRAFYAVENDVVVAGPFHTYDQAEQASRTKEFKGVTVWVLPDGSFGPELTPEEMQALPS